MLPKNLKLLSCNYLNLIVFDKKKNKSTIIILCIRNSLKSFLKKKTDENLPLRRKLMVKLRMENL